MKIIKFYKEDCTPCKMVQNFIDEQGVEVESVNPFVNPPMAIKYGIQSVPVVVLVDNEGNVVKKSIGYNPPEIEEIIGMLN